MEEERIERREVAREERKEVQIVREVREIRIDIANEVQGGSRLSKQKMTNRENADLKRAKALEQVWNNRERNAGPTGESKVEQARVVPKTCEHKVGGRRSGPRAKDAPWIG